MIRRFRLTLLATLASVGLLAFDAPNASAACLPDPPMNGDSVDCTGTDSTGYDASGATGLMIRVFDMAVLDDSDPGLDSAILISTGNTVDVDLGAQIDVTEANGFGIQGGDDNLIRNVGTITIDGADGRGISVGSRTASSPLGRVDNGVGGAFDGLIEAVGDGSIAIEVGDDITVQNFGRIDLTGDSTVAISAGDRVDYTLGTTLFSSFVINVDGANGFGIRAGDGWGDGVIANPGDPFVPTGAGIYNGFPPDPQFDSFVVMNVTGDGSYGIFAGDLANLAGNNNSYAANYGTINVTGMDSIGVSLGGNDQLVTGNPAVSTVVAFQNIGRIVGGPDAGPLVEFRSFNVGDNRIQVTTSGLLQADPTNRNMIDRGVALLGSAGVEVLLNQGVIRGDVLLGGGNDRYVHDPGAVLSGALDGGAGTDSARLNDNPGAVLDFDVGMLSNVETLLIGGGSGWTLTNSAGFDGLTQIIANGRLQVPTPITLGGDFAVDPTGTLEVTLDGTTPPLTVVGMSSFDGTLVVNAGTNLTSSLTPYRVIAANGGYTGLFATIQVPTGGTRLYTATYDANGVLVLVENLGLVAAARGDTQIAIANHLDQIQAAGGGSQQVQDFINQLEAVNGPISSAFVALSPEVYDAHTTVAVEGGRTVSNLLFDRPRECVAGDREPWSGLDSRLPCRPRSWSPWVAALGTFRQREKFSDHPRYDSQLGGLAAGIDYRPIESVDLTLAVASQRGKINVAGGGDSTITLVDVMGQAAWTHGPLRVQGAIGWGHGFHQDRRLIQESVTSTPVDVRGVTDHDSNRIGLAGEIGLAYDVGPVKIEPLVGVDWTFIDQSSIHEDEAGGFGIRIDSRDDDTGSMNAGVRLSTVYEHKRYLIRQLNWMDGVWRPQIDLQWRQVLAGNDREIQARLEGAPSAVPDFKIKGKEDNGGFEFGAGVSFIPKNANRLQFDIRYDTYIASHTFTQNLVGRVLIGF